MHRILPKISIIIPSFNQGSYIEETILSVLKQDYPNYELIIIDGSSTDNTIDILKRYGKSLTYWESEPDNGQAHAINKGFNKATGDIIGWINSDDFYLEGYLKRVGTAFMKDPRTDFVYSNSITLDNDSGKTYLEYGNLVLNDFLTFGNIVNSHTSFWRSKIHQPLDEHVNCAIDYELWIRLLREKRCHHINYFGGVFRLQPESKSMGNQSIYKRHWEDDYRYIKKKHSIKDPSLLLKRKFRIVNLVYKLWCSFWLEKQKSFSNPKALVNWLRNE